MTDLFDLKGRVALVTGGNAGLGLGMARGLAKAGASVAVWGRKADRNAEAVAQLRALGTDAEGVVCDVMDPVAVNAAMAETVGRFGRLDACFANAGGAGIRKPFLDLEPTDWAYTQRLNVDSVESTFQAAAGMSVRLGALGSEFP